MTGVTTFRKALATRPRRQRMRRLQVEPLEARRVLASLLYQALDDSPLLLVREGNQLRLVDANDPSHILEQQPLDQIGDGVRIEAAGQVVTLTIDASVPSVPGGILFDGEGQGTLAGPAADIDWRVTGDGSGTLGGEHYVRFTGVANLLGATDNEDTFCFAGDAALSGLLDGGPGGFDSLVIEDGVFDDVLFVATGPQSGSVTLDGNTIHYDGLEPITLTSPALNTVRVQGSPADDHLVVEYDSLTGFTRVRSTNASMESVEFLAPSGAVIIETRSGDDTVRVESLPPNFSASLTIDTESDLSDQEQVVVAGAIQVGSLAVTGTDEIEILADVRSDNYVILEADRSVTVSAGRAIEAGGDITITVEASYQQVWSDLLAEFGVRAVEALVDIAPTASLTGDNITIRSTATNDKRVNFLTDVAGLQDQAEVVVANTSAVFDFLNVEDQGVTRVTITRQDTGSFLSDGFAALDIISIAGTTTHDGVYQIFTVDDKVITLEEEFPDGGVVVLDDAEDVSGTIAASAVE